MNHSYQSKNNVIGKYKGCLLKEMDGDSDSELPQYSIPPKSVVKRPRKSVKKRSRSSWRKYCRKFCHHCSNVVLVLVISACLLSITLLFWFSLRLYRDVENLSRRLTIEINRVQAEQVENNEKCDSLKTTVEDHVKKNNEWRKELDSLKNQIGLSLSKVGSMNHTLIKMSKQLHDANSKVVLKTKVDALQKGMADTGAEITKLSDQLKDIGKQTSLQLSAIEKINSGLWNVSQEVTNATGKILFNPVKGIVDHFRDVDKDPKSTEPVNFKKSSFLSSQDRSEIVKMVDAINQTLSSKLENLQSEAGALKSSHIHNRTELSEIEARKQIKINTKEIKMLWSEVEVLNVTLLTIQQRIETTESGPDTQDLRRGDLDGLGLFSESASETRRSNRRGLLNNRFKSRSRKSNIGGKQLDRYNDADDDYSDT